MGARCSSIVPITSPLLLDPMAAPELRAADLQSILLFAVDLAKQAGKIILAGSESIRAAPPDAVNEKKNSVDLVTEYDVKVEELVRTEIKCAYPSYELYVPYPAHKMKCVD